MQKMYFEIIREWEHLAFNQHCFCHVERLIGHPVLLISHFISFALLFISKQLSSTFIVF